MKINEFFTVYKAEQYKVKKNPATFLTLLFPAVVFFIVDIYLLTSIQKLQGEIFGFNPWIFLLGRYGLRFLLFLYPILIAVFCHSLCEVESKNNYYKQLFVLPVSKLSLFISKISYVFFIVFLSVLLGYTMFLASGYFFVYYEPYYTFQDYETRKMAFVLFIKIFISLVAITSIQYSLSMYFKSFIVPVSFACITTVMAVFMGEQIKYIGFLPYYGIQKSIVDFYNQIDIFTISDFKYLIYPMVFIPFSYYLFKKN